MSWQMQLQALNKKAAETVQELRQLNRRQERLEEKLDLVYSAMFNTSQMIEFTPADFDPIDGVGPATAQKIVDIINAKAIATTESEPPAD
jgi:hypothetical protein